MVDQKKLAEFIPVWQIYPTFPRRMLDGATLQSLTPHGKYLETKTLERFAKTPHGKEGLARYHAPIVGEIGTVENFRFIIS